MDFSKFVGKKVLWTGSFLNDDSSLMETYILFDGGVVGFFPEIGSDEPPQVLENGLDVLKQHLDKHRKWANNVLDLANLLPHQTPAPVLA